jgi:hypothetical protein
MKFILKVASEQNYTLTNNNKNNNIIVKEYAKYYLKWKSYLHIS